MSSREPMWYCHGCNAEMRPLMLPDPHCASCHGTFVEKIENPQDDPREFHGAAGGLDDSPLDFFSAFSGIPWGAGPPPRPRSTSPPRPGGPRQRSGLRFEFNGPNGSRILLGSDIRNHRGEESDQSPNISGRPPPLSEFLRANRAPGSNDQTNQQIPGQLIAQYLFALLGGEALGVRGMPFFGPLGMGGRGSGDGRWGDYVFTQEALDQIITQMMDGANSTRPVPATEEIMRGLPREVLEAGSPLLEKDCAVCKEQFSATAEEPDEQVVVTLPCKHPFHEGCIIPWLKSSGTCPVCRHALVPQPNSNRPGSGSPGSPSLDPSGSSGSSSGNSPSASNHTPSSSANTNPESGSHGFLGSLFGNHWRTEGSSRPSDRHDGTPRTPPRSTSTSPSRDRRHLHRSRGSGGSREHRIPGSWTDFDQ